MNKGVLIYKKNTSSVVLFSWGGRILARFLKIGKVFYSKKEGRKSILGCGTDEGT